ncbi:MAG: flippase [Candidatus Pacearchaeota archaeon]|jgi:O-antigen/teichoic acid export membrane protein
MKNSKSEEKVNAGLRLLFKTSLVVLIGIILSKVLAYTYRIIIAKYFGPEIYGLYSLAIMVLGLFLSIFALGLPDGILRFVSLYRGKNETEKIRYILRFSEKISIILGFIATFILFFSSGFIANTIFHNSNLEIFLQFFSFLIPISMLTNIYLPTIRAYEKISAYSFIFNILQNVVKVVALILLILLGFASKSVIFSHIIGILIILIAAYLFCRVKLPEIFGKSTLKEKQAVKMEFFKYSLPAMSSAIVLLIFYWIDSFSIGYFMTAKDVGFYNAAVPIAMLLYFAPELFMQLLFPMITREYSLKNFKLIKELSKQINKWILIINVPIFIIMFFFPGTIINFLFGSQYLVAENSLRFLSLGTFIYSLAIVSNNLVSMAGKSNYILINTLITSIFNLILNFILVPKYGIVGAAFATMVSFILFTLLFMIQSYYFIGIFPLRRKMLNIILTAFLSGTFLFFIKSNIEITLFNLVIIGIIYMAIYILLILATKCLDKNDLMIFDSVKSKIKGFIQPEVLSD